jgi:ribonuclease BN (tRNA processing enzyme)
VTLLEGSESDADALELAILGSGSAFSPIGHNASYLLDGELLLDCGAPVTRLMGERDRPLDQLRYVAISHLHSDHFFHLPQLLSARAVRYPQAEPLRIIGPTGTIRGLDRLGRIAQGDRFWEYATEVAKPLIEDWVGGQSGDLGDFRIEAVEVEHSAVLTSFGFRISRKGIIFGYSGDTTLCAGIRQLAASVDYLLCECTSMTEPAPIHLWRQEVDELMQTNPGTRFILTHLGERAVVKGALLASDGLVLRLKPVARD